MSITLLLEIFNLEEVLASGMHDKDKSMRSFFDPLDQKKIIYIIFVYYSILFKIISNLYFTFSRFEMKFKEFHNLQIKFVISTYISKII